MALLESGSMDYPFSGLETHHMSHFQMSVRLGNVVGIGWSERRQNTRFPLTALSEETGVRLNGRVCGISSIRLDQAAFSTQRRSALIRALAASIFFRIKVDLVASALGCGVLSFLRTIFVALTHISDQRILNEDEEHG